MKTTKTKSTTKKTNCQKQRVLNNEDNELHSLSHRKALMDHYRRKYIDKVEQ
jgi:hypothetical protein